MDTNENNKMITESNDSENKPLVLVVDDNPANIQVVGVTLLKNNISVSMATDAYKALDSLKVKKPDLILLDIMMPVIDGFKLLAMLKENPETADIPVIFLTARASTEDIVEGFERGAVDYITKPFSAAELISRVSTHLKIKKLQDQVNERNKALEILNNEMNELIGITAHDLKNPIYSILMQAKNMKDSCDNYEEAVEFVDGIITASDRMLILIKKILEMNAAEQGKLATNITPNNIIEISKQLIEVFRERANAKGIQLHLVVEELIHHVLTDAKLFRQILDNLLSNAIKYSPFNKNIWIKLYEENEKACVSVRDEGPGLSEDDQRKIFQKFCKLTPQPTAQESTTGLGLSIVKKYLEMINGEIEVVSKLDEGSNFIVKVPVDPINLL